MKWQLVEMKKYPEILYILAIVDQTRFLGVSLLHLFILLGNTRGHPNHLVISLQKQTRNPNHLKLCLWLTDKNHLAGKSPIRRYLFPAIS